MSINGVIRSARIRAIHAACKAQGIDEDTRRALQLQLTGKASSKDMSLTDINAVLDHLNRGQRPSTSSGQAPSASAGKGANECANEWAFVFKLAPARQGYGKKIFRLAQRVGKTLQPPVPVASKAYIEGIASQQKGCETKLEFCDPEQLHKVVQSLEIYCKRHGV